MVRRAKEAMSDKLIQIGWNQPMSEAFLLMQKHRLRHLPVLDQDRNMIGILSDRDVQRAMKTELRWEEGLQEKVPTFEEIQFDPDAKVRHFMSWPVKAVDRNMDLRVVAGMMVVDKISAVLVMDGDRYVGIVTSEDLLKVLMGLLENRPVAKALRLDSLIGSARGFDLPLEGVI